MVKYRNVSNYKGNSSLSNYVYSIGTKYFFSLCTSFGWDNGGDLLAILSHSYELILWDANTRKKSSVDVGLKDVLSCLVWATNTPILAIGTVKGNVSIYNYNTSKWDLPSSLSKTCWDTYLTYQKYCLLSLYDINTLWNLQNEQKCYTWSSALFTFVFKSYLNSKVSNSFLYMEYWPFSVSLPVALQSTSTVGKIFLLVIFKSFQILSGGYFGSG